jgi:hypothetical protein
MRFATAQAYALLEKYGCYASEACDKCGQVLGPVRFTRKNEQSVWCSRECRGDGERPRKGGRPPKYKTRKERRAAKTRQQRDYRQAAMWKKLSRSLEETNDLQAQKSPLSHYSLTPTIRPQKRPFGRSLNRIEKRAPTRPRLRGRSSDR